MTNFTLPFIIEENLCAVGCFSFSTGSARNVFFNLSKSLRMNGLTARIHRNVNNKPKHALSFVSTKYVVHFLISYSKKHSLLLPGRIPGSNIQLLPSSTTKWAVWRVYHAAAHGESRNHAVAYSTFATLWRTLIPSIVVLCSDLCF